MSKIPFLLLGDGPAEPTGLARIARDLASQILASDLPFDLVQVGGEKLPLWAQWRHVALDRSQEWGAAQVQQIYQDLWGTTPGILFAVWDPSRLYPLTQLEMPVQRWAYCAIDGGNVRGAVGGPAAVALREFDRVLAYGSFGAEVIKATTGRKCQWLPHGVTLSTYQPVSDEQRAWAQAKLGPHALNKVIVGSVMTNQPRKDFGLLFGLIAQLRNAGVNAYLWLHTDELVKAWSVQQLVEDFGLAKLVTVTGVNGDQVSDSQMAALYQACTVTVLPSLGEGFGYSIAESMASGVPCVHSQCAEGQQYVPRSEWKVPVREIRLESVYGIVRPVMRAEDWRNATKRAIDWAQQEGEVGKAYLRGCVANLDWGQLWSRWHSWFKQGLA